MTPEERARDLLERLIIDGLDPGHAADVPAIAAAVAAAVREAVLAERQEIYREVTLQAGDWPGRSEGCGALLDAANYVIGRPPP